MEQIIKEIAAAIHNADVNVRQNEKIIAEAKSKYDDAAMVARRVKQVHEYYARRFRAWKERLEQERRNLNNAKYKQLDMLRECRKNTIGL